MVEKGEATNDENDGGLGGATKLCRQKKDNTNKEGLSENKPKVCFRQSVYITLHLCMFNRKLAIEQRKLNHNRGKNKLKRNQRAYKQIKAKGTNKINVNI